MGAEGRCGATGQRGKGAEWATGQRLEAGRGAEGEEAAGGGGGWWLSREAGRERAGGEDSG